MNYQMTTRTARVITAKALTLVSLLLLTACDGGIFGTGGTLDSSSGEPLNEAGLSTDGTSVTDSAATPNVEDTVGDTGAVDTENDSDSTPASPESNTDAGVNTDTVTSPDIDPSVNPDVDPDEDTSTSATDDLTDTGADTDTDTGAADSDTADTDAADAGVSDSASILSAGFDSVGSFTNTTATLDGPDAQIIVVNISSLTLNVTSTISEADTEDNLAPFEIAGIEPNSSSAMTALSANSTNIAIIDPDIPTQVQIFYADFFADPSSLTTLLIREDEIGINSVALVTETQTSDPELAKVRIVQGDALGNAELASQLRLLSAGDNPGGVDKSFGPLSFGQPASEYIELSAGDYELTDQANRFMPVPVTLTGGSVYTLVITGNSTNDMLTIIDSDTQ